MCKLVVCEKKSLPVRTSILYLPLVRIGNLSVSVSVRMQGQDQRSRSATWSLSPTYLGFIRDESWWLKSTEPGPSADENSFLFSFCDKGQERIRRAGITPAETIATWGDVSLLPEGDLVPNVKLVDVLQSQWSLLILVHRGVFESEWMIKSEVGDDPPLYTQRN